MPSSLARWYELRDTRVAVPQHVVFRDMADETVLLNVSTGRYHSIDAIGARFFEVLRAGDPLSSVASTLAADFKQPIDVIQHDLAEFCARMAELGLFELEH